ncbi:hypothetical protein J6590_018546 [Homalodisca vitripennis]|nr:hypothetical protein J6590_018546 [Homalodisca vitripennis]
MASIFCSTRREDALVMTSGADRRNDLLHASPPTLLASRGATAAHKSTINTECRNLIKSAVPADEISLSMKPFRASCQSPNNYVPL